MTHDDATALIHRLHSLRMRNEPEGLLDVFHEDASFALAGQPRAGSLAMRSDGAPFLEVARALVATWHWVEIEFHSILHHGDEVAARYTLTARHVPTDTVITTEIAEFCTVKDGKVSDMHQFVDTAHTGAVAAGMA